MNPSFVSFQKSFYCYSVASSGDRNLRKGATSCLRGSCWLGFSLFPLASFGCFLPSTPLPSPVQLFKDQKVKRAVETALRAEHSVLRLRPPAAAGRYLITCPAAQRDDQFLKPVTLFFLQVAGCAFSASHSPPSSHGCTL